MTDPNGIGLMLAVLVLLGLALILAAGVQWLVEPRATRRKRFVQRDRVAERKRVIVRNGFKSRMRNHREFGL